MRLTAAFNRILQLPGASVHTVTFTDQGAGDRVTAATAPTALSLRSDHDGSVRLLTTSVAAPGLRPSCCSPGVSCPAPCSRRPGRSLQVLLQWDDEGNDRQLALDLFDAFGSKEKTLHANMGGHTGVPQFEGDDANRFFARHLN